MRAAAPISLARQLPLVFRSRSLASQAAVLLQLQAANRALSRRAERARSRVADAREGERGQVCCARGVARVLRPTEVCSWTRGLMVMARQKAAAPGFLTSGSFVSYYWLLHRRGCAREILW